MRSGRQHRGHVMRSMMPMPEKLNPVDLTAGRRPDGRGMPRYTGRSRPTRSVPALMSRRPSQRMKIGPGDRGMARSAWMDGSSRRGVPLVTSPCRSRCPRTRRCRCRWRRVMVAATWVCNSPEAGASTRVHEAQRGRMPARCDASAHRDSQPRQRGRYGQRGEPAAQISQVIRRDGHRVAYSCACGA